ncbi:MAG: universal stress protein [Acidimicrobiia bacterium]
MIAPHAREPEQIAVGIDGSLASRAAVRWAIDHALDRDTVTLVHVWQASPTLVDAGIVDPEDDTAPRSFAGHELARAKALPHSAGVTLKSEVLHGDPRDCLCELNTDLLAVGARGQGGVAGLLLGSVSCFLARHAHSPLVIVPSPSRKLDEPPNR